MVLGQHFLVHRGVIGQFAKVGRRDKQFQAFDEDAKRAALLSTQWLADGERYQER